MNYRRRDFRILLLPFLAALGMAMFMASAQANGAGWLIEGKALLASFTGSQEGLSRLLILKLNLLLKCAHWLVVHAHTNAATGHSLKRILHQDCYYTDLALTKNTTCSVGHYEEEVLTQLYRHNGAGYLLLTPVTGTTFATIKNSGAECTLPETAELKGSFTAAISTKDQVVNLITTKSMLSLFPSHTLAYGAHVSHSETDMTISLTGSHTGMKWGYHL